MTDAPFDLAVTDKLLSTTRAVRKRLDLDRPVEREVLLECIDLAQQAPTGGNRQKWHWLVVTDEAKRRELGRIYQDASAEYLAAPPADAPNLDPEQQSRVRSSSRYLRDVMPDVPALVVPCAEGRPEDLSIAAQASWYGSIIPAVWSFMLALRSRGLGSCYTTLHLNEEQRAADLLGIPDGITQLALLPVAYTKGTDFKPVKRPPAEQIVSFDTW
ncbi:nitroreductase family protein [Cumulibacter manganitolerans]|uniref:nitroreductase family protein n=1 Tax=Cumulibacter manganitolerans TaxID=1884992 RepID=UPI0012951F4D|nr:nitroreductase family protein [Cumulibacter manganitolerans]